MTMRRLVSSVTGMVMIVILLVSCTPKASARVYIENAKFMVDGQEIWFTGCNTPWYYWNDFSGNMDEKAWEDTFKLLHSDGINCTRIWVNCAGTGIVDFKRTGEIRSINEGHWSDLDKLFKLAKKYKVYVMPTLTSFDHFKNTNNCDGWRAMIKSHELTDAFAESYVAEFAKRYGSCECIMGVDIVNEPDWIYENAECGNIPWDDISYFIGACSSAIHENSELLVTAGMGIIKYNSDKYEGNKISDDYLKALTGKESSYIDFYSTHYYNWQKPWFSYPFDKSPESFGLDMSKPCLIGETDNAYDEEFGHSLADKYVLAYENGWQGVLTWTQTDFNGNSGCDEVWYRYDLIREASNSMAEYLLQKQK